MPSPEGKILNPETSNERIIISALEDFLESKGLVMEF